VQKRGVTDVDWRGVRGEERAGSASAAARRALRTAILRQFEERSVTVIEW
jgi:hypothetical protein